MITLLTDFGTKDGYAGIIKGVIFGINPKVTIIDITHAISAQNIKEAAFILKASYSYFPKGTIHVAIVDPGVGSNRKTILVQTKKYYFVCPDNGLLTYVLNEEKVEKIIELTNKKYFLKEISNTFHGRDIFAPVSAHLSKGVKITEFGKPIHSIIKFKESNPIIKRTKSGVVIAVKIIHVDHFGNLVTNVTKKSLDGISNKEKITFKIGTGSVNGISKSYSDVSKNKPLAIWGSSGFLEISVREGSAYHQFLKGGQND